MTYIILSVPNSHILRPNVHATVYLLRSLTCCEYSIKSKEKAKQGTKVSLYLKFIISPANQRGEPKSKSQNKTKLPKA